jgi:DNA-directed RNA polymerase specialized sigma24 family protein
MRTPKVRAGRKPPGRMTWQGGAGGAGAGGRAQASSAEPGAGQAVRLDEDVSRTVAALYQEHYRSLVRLAALLVADLAAAEEIVQEAFADTHGTWRTLPGHDAALRYLRRSLVRRSRSIAQSQDVAGMRAAGLPAAGAPAGGAPAGGAPAGGAPAGGAPAGGLPAAGPEASLLSVLRALPVRQREVLVLRYFADLPEAEIASVTGTRPAVIRTYAAQGMSSLRAGLPGNVA